MSASTNSSTGFQAVASAASGSVESNREHAGRTKSLLLHVCNLHFRLSGRALRIARLDADMYHFLSDPAPAIEALRKQRERIDLFTFTQTLVDTTPHYSYPMEWENLAVLP